MGPTVNENPRFLNGTPLSRRWLGVLLRMAVEQAERDMGARLPCGMAHDRGQYVLGYLVAHTDLSDHEQTALIARILGQDCRI